jgi:hypothetical protein
LEVLCLKLLYWIKKYRHKNLLAISLDKTKTSNRQKKINIEFEYPNNYP